MNRTTLVLLVAAAVALAAAPAPDAAAQLQQLLGTIQPPLQVTTVNGKVVVSGRISTDADEETFQKAMALFPDVVDLVSIETAAPLIGVRALFIEVEESNGHDVTVLDPDDVFNGLDVRGYLGFEEDWINGLPPTEHKGIDWTVNVDTRILRAIRAMVDKGKAKVVARPYVVVEDGEQASLLSGGEIPYVTSDWRSTNTTFKPYGIRLDVTPELQPSGDVEMDITVESSEPSNEPHAGGITARRATTRASIGNGKSLLVAGLTTASTRSGRSFGCLFPLFQSGAAVSRKQLLVLVTPEVPPTGGLGGFDLIPPGDLQK
jgi:pilus assembly protein CpaC